MKKKKQIESTEWLGRLQTFTSGNRGRAGTIMVGDMTLVEHQPLVGVYYDPAGKGNDMVLTLKGYDHVISDPVELYMIEESDGVVSALEIVDKNGTSTHLNLS